MDIEKSQRVSRFNVFGIVRLFKETFLMTSKGLQRDYNDAPSIFLMFRDKNGEKSLRVPVSVFSAL